MDQLAIPTCGMLTHRRGVADTGLERMFVEHRSDHITVLEASRQQVVDRGALRSLLDYPHLVRQQSPEALGCTRRASRRPSQPQLRAEEIALHQTGLDRHGIAGTARSSP